MSLRVVPIQRFRSLQAGVSAIALFGTLAISTPGLTAPAAGASLKPSARIAQQIQPAFSGLPRQIERAVLRTHASQTQTPIRQLRIASFSKQMWSDGCLGLGRPEESCIAVMTEGWRVEVTHNNQRWVYRTDLTGDNIRAETTPDTEQSLPTALTQKLLSTVAREQRVPVRQLKLAAARSRVWDGCLGVAGPTEACTKIAISGWQVIVTGPQRYWVYHTDQTGSRIKWNPTTSASSPIAPTFWQPDENWPPATIGNDVVFQSITSGGFAGQTSKTVLMQDGRVMRMRVQGNVIGTSVLVRRLSAQQVRQFVQLLQSNEFGDFSGFNYPAPAGAADYFTIALMSPQGATQYADMEVEQLPTKLQRTIQAWSRITR